MATRKPCFIPYCTTRIARHLLMCPFHWNRVPTKLQEQVWLTYRAINENLRAYVLATKKAALAVVETESDRTNLVLASETALRTQIAELEARQHA